LETAKKLVPACHTYFSFPPPYWYFSPRRANRTPFLEGPVLAEFFTWWRQHLIELVPENLRQGANGQANALVVDATSPGIVILPGSMNQGCPACARHSTSARAASR
jgi:hypothetical protein